MAAMAMNCRLVKPVSNTKFSWIARSMASAAKNMSSNRWRAARITHWLVWNALWVQSKLPSWASRSWPISNGIWVWRISSSAPRLAIVRQALSRPKRAMRNSATAPAYSTRATAPLWNLTSPSGVEVIEEAGLAERRAHTEHGGVLLPLIRDVLPVGRAVDLVPVTPCLVRQPRTAADLLREQLPLIDVAGRPVDLASEV